MTESDTPQQPPQETEPASAMPAAASRLLDAMEAQVLGQRDACEMLLATYMAGGHALLEGVPGIGKTLLARTFASALGLGFHRVQFTPDLMPTDVVGTHVFDREGASFRLVKGPIFTQVLMADEINRTPPKTQSALLESMQERQVTIDGDGHQLDPSFFVIATQNPVELEGTYPLPEAQLDRFLTRIVMAVPPAEAEMELFRRAVRGTGGLGYDALPEPVVTPQEAADLRRASRAVHVSDELLDYLARLAAAVRTSDHLELAVSPRGALALLETARALALLDERDYVTPDDVKRCLGPCWRHRLILNAEAELEGNTASRMLDAVSADVEVPK